MKLPNPERAVVDIEKLRDYCLSFEHLRGRHKARVFLSVLGLTAIHVSELYFALRNAAENEDATIGQGDEYGQRYVLDFVMTGPRGRATVRSAWIVRAREDFPRLISCYIP
ncbi:MAG TPA: hypothetical protein VGE45_02005 [Chloroflexia bacterium]